MDASNPVIKLCVDGMQAEAERRPDDARDLFLRAWAMCTDDFEACVAAHYVARHQPTPEDALRWNQEALTRADAVGDERVQNYYPSLYLNLGRSHEELGDQAAAWRCYELAADRARDLPADPYGDLVRRGIAEGRERTRPSGG